MVHEDLKPSDIMTREAFLNAIVVNSAIGGSTNAPIHLAAIARHMGVELALQDWQEHGHKVPLLVNLQPAGEYLGEDYYHAGGVPAVVSQLMGAGPDPRSCADRQRPDHRRQLPGRRDRGRARHPPLRRAAAEGRGLHRAVGQPVRLGDHEDQRDLAANSARAISAIPTIRMPSRARSSCSTGRRITTPGSTIRRWRSMSTPCW